MYGRFAAWLLIPLLLLATRIAAQEPEKESTSGNTAGAVSPSINEQTIKSISSGSSAEDIQPTDQAQNMSSDVATNAQQVSTENPEKSTQFWNTIDKAQEISSESQTKSSSTTEKAQQISSEGTVANIQLSSTKEKTEESESTDSDHSDDLFILENLGLEMPVKSAVHVLNTKLLKEMLLKKLSEKFEKYVQELPKKRPL
uniref:Uncharacterized protein n=1 Tax=Setaria digitata TaxID=48799 RepID=A0A915PW54_9BILA